MFTCLVCSTAQVSTVACVLCFTTGQAAPAHMHDTTFLAADTDMVIPGPTGNIPSHIWTGRRNAAGRLWYMHNITGFKTHLQPLTTTNEDPLVNELPPGWQVMLTPDGKLWY